MPGTEARAPVMAAAPAVGEPAPSSWQTGEGQRGESSVRQVRLRSDSGYGARRQPDDSAETGNVQQDIPSRNREESTDR